MEEKVASTELSKETARENPVTFAIAACETQNLPNDPDADNGCTRKLPPLFSTAELLPTDQPDKMPLPKHRSNNNNSGRQYYGEFTSSTAAQSRRRLLIACASDNSDDLIQILVSDLDSGSIDDQKMAAMEVRLLAKNKSKNRPLYHLILNIGQIISAEKRKSRNGKLLSSEMSGSQNECTIGSAMQDFRFPIHRGAVSVLIPSILRTARENPVTFAIAACETQNINVTVLPCFGLSEGSSITAKDTWGKMVQVKGAILSLRFIQTVAGHNARSLLKKSRLTTRYTVEKVVSLSFSRNGEEAKGHRGSMEVVQQPRLNPSQHHCLFDSTAASLRQPDFARGAYAWVVAATEQRLSSFGQRTRPTLISNHCSGATCSFPFISSVDLVTGAIVPITNHIHLAALLFELCHEAFHKFSMGFCIESLRRVACLDEDFNGKAGQSTVPRLSGIGSKRVGLIGLGQSTSTTAAHWSLGESVAAVAKASQASNVAIVIASPEGLSAESKLNTASAIVSGVLAEEASKIASMYSDVISATILDVEQCKELKMGSYLGVVAASENPPDFIHLCYKPSSGPVKTKLALVGKGLTFDRALSSKQIRWVKGMLRFSRSIVLQDLLGTSSSWRILRVTKENRTAGVLDNFAEGENYSQHALRKFVGNKAPEIMPNINKFFTDPN
ncbi:hypothetical protein RHGRI_017247 [Rhododendron griersonianum]|uniref:Cytosol aminopeptidase domain-containing protein n=1 Tax=Rhododendron griersonianum TaxID=479676 RepID=A0AAV6JX35_9ERIC|nr:hypothetical protein RHGRI_017247 [Rhododendron griersonianum]